MVAVLVAVRDFLIALALAWVGVSLEARQASDPACVGEACDTQRDTR